MAAEIFRDFEDDLTSFTYRIYDDGRFTVLMNGAVIYDKDRTHKFPKYETDIKSRLSSASA